ncbi:unnamed protein product, partial [Rotaria magnacalcarata]
MFETTPNGSSIQIIDCKKRLFDEDDSIDKEKDNVENQQRSSIKKQKIIASRYHRQIPNQPFVVLTSHQNERYYLLEREEDDDCFKLSLNGRNKRSLLKVSVDDMIEKNVRQELDELTKSIDKSTADAENDDDSTLPIVDQYTDELWVEKFAPRAFCDLLSDI